VTLAGRQTANVEIPLALTRRGRYLLGPFTAGSGFPIGLANWRRTLTAEEEIVVLPRLGSLRRGVLRRHLQQHSPTVARPGPCRGAIPRRRPIFTACARFSPATVHAGFIGEPRRRRGELMVKEFEGNPSDNLDPDR